MAPINWLDLFLFLISLASFTLITLWITKSTVTIKMIKIPLTMMMMPVLFLPISESSNLAPINAEVVLTLISSPYSDIS